MGDKRVALDAYLCKAIVAERLRPRHHLYYHAHRKPYHKRYPKRCKHSFYAYPIKKKPSMRELVINNGEFVINNGMRMNFGVWAPRRYLVFGGSRLSYRRYGHRAIIALS